MIKVERGEVELEGTGLDISAEMTSLLRNYCRFLTKELGAGLAKKFFESVLETAFSPELSNPFEEENDDEDDD